MTQKQKQTANSIKRSQREQRRQQQQRKRMFTWGGVILVSLAVIAALGWFLSRSPAAAQAMGDVVAVDSRDHIPLGSDPGPYSTDPPVGGHHYPSTYDPGFYSTSDVQSLPKMYQGYLVHNQEHGYVIYWYNCAANPKINCDDLQSAIKQVIQENNSFKVIGFPWPSLKQPLVMTSWGRIMRMDKVDLATMRAFYKGNVDKGPEQTPN